MKVFTISYSGIIHGGFAVVVAPSEEEAIAMFRAHPQTPSHPVADDGKIWEIKTIDLTAAAVIYNDDGDM